jgi:hypothetical protein
MIFESDEGGKIFTEVITKKPVEVLIQTTSQLIHGFVHIRPQARLKDEMDQDELSLAVTDVIVYEKKDVILFQSKFLALNRRQIVWIIPCSELVEARQE